MSDKVENSLEDRCSYCGDKFCSSTPTTLLYTENREQKQVVESTIINNHSFRCHYCGKNFCYIHKLPESHSCIGLKSSKGRNCSDNRLYRSHFSSSVLPKSFTLILVIVLVAVLYNSFRSVNLPTATQINTEDKNLTPVVESILLKSGVDNYTHITSVNVIPRFEITTQCGDSKALGCFNPNDNSIYISDLFGFSDSFDSNGYLMMATMAKMNSTDSTEVGHRYYNCGTFSHVLYHEIGHAKYISLYGVHDYSNIEYYKRPDEIYAENYANQSSKNKCQSDTIMSIENRLKSLKLEVDRTTEQLSASQQKLSQWDKYGKSVPAKLYNTYMRDYNNYKQIYDSNARAIEQFNSLINEEDNYFSTASNVGEYP